MQMMINLKSKFVLVLFILMAVYTEYDKMILTHRFPALYSHGALRGMCSGHTSSPDLTLSNQIAEGSNHS